MINSKIYTKEQLIEAVKTSKTMADTLRKIGLDPRGSNYKTVKRIINSLKIDNSHWTGKFTKDKITSNKYIPILEILIENSRYRSIKNLKLKLVRLNLLKYECSICKIQTWQNSNLSLQLDHINGISNDHRLENLRFLCPNCHSQTETFCGKNKKKYKNDKELKVARKKQSQDKCPSEFCLNFKAKRAHFCRSCTNKNQKTKIIWPSDDELLKMLSESNFFQLGKKLGVSDNAIRKHMKRRNLI